MLRRSAIPFALKKGAGDNVLKPAGPKLNPEGTSHVPAK
jgi:hypothetical protein